MADQEVVNRVAQWMNGIENEVSLRLVSAQELTYAKLYQESSGDESAGGVEDDASSVASSVASEESDTSDEATDPGIIPLAMGLDQVCLTSFRIKRKFID